MNDYQFKVVRIEGDFIWHDHQGTGEAFLVLEGELRIDMRQDPGNQQNIDPLGQKSGNADPDINPDGEE